MKHWLTPQAISSQKVLFGLFSIPIILAAMVGSAQAQKSTDEARASRTAELDARVLELKDQYKILKAKWTQAADQAKSNVQAELEEAARELAEAYEQREETYEAKLIEWSASLDSTWKDLQSKGEVAQADAMKKLNEIRDAWQASLKELKQSHQQRVEHYRGELNAIEKQFAVTADELNAEWIARRTASRKQYQQTSASMRESYLQAIAALEKEIERLQAEAAKASAENRGKLEAIADSMSQQMNVFHQELESSYRETAEKAQSYYSQTVSRISQAGTGLKGTITAEVDQVAESVCELGAEWTSSCERYHEVLDQQLASLTERAASAKGEAKRKLDTLVSELRTQRKTADEKIAYAYSAYAAALKADVDRLEQRLTEADDTAREVLVKTIERRQAELEKAKQKLKERNND